MTPDTRCGLVAVIGAPNAGKSTLVNALVGQKVAITSAKAQTTRARLMGIALHDSSQMLLVDTPGIFDPTRRLDRAMVAAAWEGAMDADIIMLVVDARKKRDDRLTDLIERLKGRSERLVLVLNKVDGTARGKLLPKADQLNSEAEFDEIFFISALKGDGIDELKQWLAANMPQGPWHFPEDQVSDASERLLAAEVTREQLYRQLHQELPYASMVVPESYSLRRDGSAEIRQQIIVARESQRAIVLGKSGSRIKSIGEAARKELAVLLDCPVHLFLHVKVRENWDEDPEIYRDIGLDWVK